MRTKNLFILMNKSKQLLANTREVCFGVSTFWHAIIYLTFLGGWGWGGANLACCSWHLAFLSVSPQLCFKIIG